MSETSETSEYSQSSQSNVLITLPEYETEEEHIKIDHSKKKSNRKTKVKNKIYVLEKNFESTALANEAISSEKIWSRQTTKPPGRKGQKIYYRCNLAMFRDPACAASLCLFLPAHNTTAELHRTIYKFNVNI